jgi:hypothetical protein
VNDPASARLEQRRQRALAEIRRMDGVAQHAPGYLCGGYPEFWQNLECAIDALRGGILGTTPPPAGSYDLLAQALVMLEDLLAVLKPTPRA